MGSELVDVFVETPRGSRVKYEYDHDRQGIRLDRPLFSATVYPADYGFLPDTKSADGEALDALILADEATFPGCWVRARPIGVFWIAYGDQREAKILAVADMDPNWADVNDLTDVPAHRLDEISHFFDVYKDLEPGTSPSAAGFEGRAVALGVIDQALGRGQSTQSG